MQNKKLSRRDGRRGFIYRLLRIFMRAVLPVGIVGVTHCMYALSAYPWVQARLWIYPWLLVLLVFFLLGWVCSRVVRTMKINGKLSPWFDYKAAQLYERYAWRLLISDQERPVDMALVTHDGAMVLLVLTNQRLIAATLNRFMGGIHEVTDCDRLAVQRAVSREAKPGPFSWVTGFESLAAIQITIVGVQNSQSLMFLEPVSMARILSKLQNQSRLLPGKNGIRQILLFKKRKVLKRRYVENLFTSRQSNFNISIVLSLLFPGLGQLQQGRPAYGLTFGLSTAAWLWGSFQSYGPQTLTDTGIDVSVIVLLLLWLASLIELYIHRSGSQVPTAST